MLTVVEVREKSCVLSTGEVLIVRWEKLRALCEQLCQDGSAIWIRTWTSSDGEELIEAHRCGEPSTDRPTATRSGDSDAF